MCGPTFAVVYSFFSSPSRGTYVYFWLLSGYGQSARILRRTQQYVHLMDRNRLLNLHSLAWTHSPAAGGSGRTTVI